MTKTTVVLKTMGITKKTSVWACDISDHHPGMYVGFAQGGGGGPWEPQGKPSPKPKTPQIGHYFLGAANFAKKGPTCSRGPIGL